VDTTAELPGEADGMLDAVIAAATANSGAATAASGACAAVTGPTDDMSVLKYVVRGAANAIHGGSNAVVVRAAR
jgi:hypothetical protein